VHRFDDDGLFGRGHGATDLVTLDVVSLQGFLGSSHVVAPMRHDQTKADAHVEDATDVPEPGRAASQGLLQTVDKRLEPDSSFFVLTPAVAYEERRRAVRRPDRAVRFVLGIG
jgi:hypothetical protein